MNHEEIIKRSLDYNPHTGELTWSNLASRNRGKKAGSHDVDGYIQVNIKGKGYRGHRLALFLFYGYWPSGEVDHINNVRDDNSIRNLRDCLGYQNQGNRVKQKGTTSKYKGVSWNKHHMKWQVHIRVQRKQINLGFYDNEEHAARAYRVAAVKHFGEFSKCPGLDDGAV